MYVLDMSKSATMFNSRNALPLTKSLIADGSWKMRATFWIVAVGCSVSRVLRQPLMAPA